MFRKREAPESLRLTIFSKPRFAGIFLARIFFHFVLVATKYLPFHSPGPAGSMSLLMNSPPEHGGGGGYERGVLAAQPVDVGQCARVHLHFRGNDAGLLVVVHYRAYAEVGELQQQQALAHRWASSRKRRRKRLSRETPPAASPNSSWAVPWIVRLHTAAGCGSLQRVSEIALI